MIATINVVGGFLVTHRMLGHVPEEGLASAAEQDRSWTASSISSISAASVLFILGIRGLTHPRTAVRGNLLGATGMLLAVVATLLDQQILRPPAARPWG